MYNETESWTETWSDEMVAAVSVIEREGYRVIDPAHVAALAVFVNAMMDMYDIYHLSEERGVQFEMIREILSPR